LGRFFTRSGRKEALEVGSSRKPSVNGRPFAGLQLFYFVSRGRRMGKRTISAAQEIKRLGDFQRSGRGATDVPKEKVS